MEGRRSKGGAEGVGVIEERRKRGKCKMSRSNRRKEEEGEEQKE